MEVTDDILAIYAAGMATDDQKMAVRNYVAHHPEEMETLALAMDKYIDIVPKNYLEIKCCCGSRKNVQVKRMKTVKVSMPKENTSKSDGDFWLQLLNDLDVK